MIYLKGSILVLFKPRSGVEGDGLWEGQWSTQGEEDRRSLAKLTWQERDGIAEAVEHFKSQLLALDRDDAAAKDGKHRGHHTHFNGGATSCSCGVLTGVTSFVPPPEDEPQPTPQCTECGQLGVWKLDVNVS